MRYVFLALGAVMVMSWCLAATAQEVVYEGPWYTTNRKLDGTMTCVVTEVSDQQWRGRFFGVWQGVSFDYTVPFEGPPSDLKGKAQIDGADYVWKGQLSEGTGGSFKGAFGGTRYTGNFDLKEKTRNR
jgi:hypothetical protein